MRWLALHMVLLAGLLVQAQWEDLDGGLSGGNASVHRLFYDELDGKLYVVGNFLHAHGSGQLLNGVGYWQDGAWHPLGTGMSWPFANPVRDIQKFEGEVVATGSFQMMSGVPNTRMVARWRNGAWESMGVDSARVISGFGLRLRVVDDRLHLLGNFRFVNQQGDTLNRWAWWNGEDWVAGDPEANFNLNMHDIIVYQDQLHMAGNFTQPAGPRIVRQVPGGYEPLGSGLVGESVHHVREYDGLLWMTGIFQGGGQAYSPGIIAWDGSNWLAPFPMLNAISQGRGLEVIDGKLYFTASFQVLGQEGIYRLARYDGQQLCMFGGEGAFAIQLAGNADTLFVSTCTRITCDDNFGLVVRKVAKWPMDAEPDFCFDVVVGVEEQAGALPPLQVYPNPARRPATVQRSGAMEAATLEVYDALGRLVQRQAWPSGQAMLELDLGERGSGVYLLRVTGRHGTGVQQARLLWQP